MPRNDPSVAWLFAAQSVVLVDRYQVGVIRPPVFSGL